MTSISVPQPALSLSLSPVGGRWVNQLGSEMVVSVGPGGRLEGEYCAAAGSLAGKSYPVLGHCQVRTDGRLTPIAFIVAWTEAHCITAWCGDYVAGPVEEIRATWLMTSETEPGEEWRATVTGHDVFRRAGGGDPASSALTSL